MADPQQQLPPGATLVSGDLPPSMALPPGATLVSGKVPAKDSAASRLGTNFLSGLGVTSNDDAKKFIAHPLDTVINSFQRQGELALKAKQAYDRGDYEGALQHALNYLVPFVGQQTDKAGEQIKEGDVAGGIGRTLGVAVPIVAGSPEVQAGTKSAALTTADTSAAVVRAAAQKANAALAKAPGTVGAVVGGAAGAATKIPYATEVGAGLGSVIGKEVLPQVRIPGEGFGLPSRVTGGPAEAPPFEASPRTAPDLPAAFQSPAARPPAVPGTVDAPFQGPAPQVVPRPSPDLPAAFQPLPAKAPGVPGTADTPFQMPERFSPPAAAAEPAAAPAVETVAKNAAGSTIPRTLSGESALRQVLGGQDNANLLKIARSRGINVSQEAQLKPGVADSKLIEKIVNDFSDDELKNIGDTYLENTRMGPQDFRSKIGAEANKTLSLQTYFPDVKIPTATMRRTQSAVTAAKVPGDGLTGPDMLSLLNQSLKQVAQQKAAQQ